MTDEDAALYYVAFVHHQYYPCGDLQDMIGKADTLEAAKELFTDDHLSPTDAWGCVVAVTPTGLEVAYTTDTA
ncbi:MAG: hypothetical protein ACYTAS_19145 [Planctomycetota bacterium]|jgi:hypothetical protein